jgi:hypothetical protein
MAVRLLDFLERGAVTSGIQFVQVSFLVSTLAESIADAEGAELVS